MRTPLFVIALLAAGPALAQQPGQPQLGARTQSPDSMAGALNRVSPEEEMRQLAAAADAYPLGSLENPVRVGGPEGERAYLSRLRCSGGSTPQIGGRGDGGVGAFGSVVDAVALSCGGSRVRLMFDIYHEEHVETRAPAGFTLAS